MSEDKNTKSEEDFDVRLQQARGSGERGPTLTDSQTGKGMALRMGTEIVAAVAVGGGIGYLIDAWLDTKPWFLIILLFLGNAAGLWNVFRLTSNQGYAAGFTVSKQRDSENSEAPKDGR